MKAHILRTFQRPERNQQVEIDCGESLPFNGVGLPEAELIFKEKGGEWCQKCLAVSTGVPETIFPFPYKFILFV